MASVGHSLVGLSFAGFSDRESRGGKLPYAWLGFMVLMGHLVDVVEWFVVLVAPEYFNRHFVTNSPMVTAGLAALVCLVLFIVCRVRKIIVYVLTVLAIFSHLLLDATPVREAVAKLYFSGERAGEEMPSVTESIPAEIWAYGGLLVLVLLLNASRQKGVPQGGRILSACLAIAVIGTAVTRIPYVWGPTYALAALHALLLYRRSWTWRIFWGLAPAAPMILLLGFEVWSVHLYREATRLRRDTKYAAAEEAYRTMIDVPTRSPKDYARVYLASCLMNQGRFGEAEAELIALIVASNNSDFARITLVAMYMSPNTKGTEYHKLGEAAALCEEILAGQARKHLKEIARRRLRQLNAAGVMGPSGRPIGDEAGRS